ncbi:S26 family signal peptidase [Candidatus Omnitrophota bacterium]
MSPFIKNNDVITISPLVNSMVGYGDIVGFIHPGLKRTVVHRVVGRKKQHYIIKGDNTLGIDGFFLKMDIAGRITKVERQGKSITFGLGPERRLIAILSRTRILFILLNILRMITHPWKKRTKT